MNFRRFNIKLKFKTRINPTPTEIARHTQHIPKLCHRLTDMWAPRSGRARLSYSHRETERGDRPLLPPADGENRGGGGAHAEAPRSGDGGLAGSAKTARTGCGVRAHPQVASARPEVACDRLTAVTGGAARGGSVGGACRRPTGPRKGRFEGGARRSWW
jgi:hypothetical protein